MGKLFNCGFKAARHLLMLGCFFMQIFNIFNPDNAMEGKNATKTRRTLRNTNAKNKLIIKIVETKK